MQICDKCQRGFQNLNSLNSHRSKFHKNNANILSHKIGLFLELMNEIDIKYKTKLCRGEVEDYWEEVKEAYIKTMDL